jgi:hypothetical protein
MNSELLKKASLNDKLAYLYGYYSLFRKFPGVNLSDEEKQELVDYITSHCSPENEVMFNIVIFLT